MPVFNKLTLKQIDLYINNKDKFSDKELKEIFMNMITYKMDGSKYGETTINQKLLTLNKKLVKDYDITILSSDSNKVVDKWRQDRIDHPIEEKKEDEKMEISADEIKTIKTPYIDFLYNDEYKDIYNDKKNRKKRNTFLEMVNGVYGLLLINSGIRLNELLTRDFKESGRDVIFRLSKTESKVREFIPLFMTNKEWLKILDDVRSLVGKELISSVNKRFNVYLKNTYHTITKSHSIRKIYSNLIKDSNNNPLYHSDRDMLKVYDVVKYNDEDKEQVEELKEEAVENTTKKKNTKKRCELCDRDIVRKNWARHLRSSKHKKKVIKENSK
jgi:hypothetical protein